MKITINGQSAEVNYAPETPLLWVIRDELGLKGTKFGCGRGLCGACTVHVDNQPARACITPVSAVVGRRITTIEGLGSPESPHPLQVAWQTHSVPQCGYCQSGQLMSASALLMEKPSPTDEDIDLAMTGNICRCGTYARVRSAIKAAAGIEQAPPAVEWFDPAELDADAVVGAFAGVKVETVTGPGKGEQGS